MQNQLIQEICQLIPQLELDDLKAVVEVLQAYLITLMTEVKGV